MWRWRWWRCQFLWGLVLVSASPMSFWGLNIWVYYLIQHLSQVASVSNWSRQVKGPAWKGDKQSSKTREWLSCAGPGSLAPEPLPAVHTCLLHACVQQWKEKCFVETGKIMHFKKILCVAEALLKWTHGWKSRPQNWSLRAMVLCLPNAVTFNPVPHVVVTP